MKRTEKKETFEEAYRAWMNERRKQVTVATADRYEYLLEKFILPELGQMEVEEISPEQVGALVVSLSDADERGEDAIGASIAETLLGFTNSIISGAKGDYAAQRMRIREQCRKSEQSHYAPLSTGEIRKLISCARFHKSPEMLGVLLALYTGIGTGELCALTWDDVDLRRREIYIHNTLYRVKDKEGGEKKTKLTVMPIRASHIRTVSYPKELDSYMRSFYKKGTVFLTCEKGRYLEQKTFCYRLERAFSGYGLAGLTLQRVSKTYKEGLSELRFLQDPFYRPEGSGSTATQINERWLIKEMENDLAALRSLLGLSGEELGQMMGLSEAEYLAFECGEMTLDWHSFLSLLFFFRYNAKTEGVVDALGLYPKDLREKLSIRKRSRDDVEAS